MLNVWIFRMPTNNTKAVRTTLSNIEILFEDNHLLIINKRSGDLVQGDQTGDVCLLEILKDYLKKKYNKPGNVFLGLVHRLDRPTSGVVVYAKTSKALTRMSELFKNRETQKTYWAVVKNLPPKLSDELIHFLKKNPKNNTAKVYTKEVPESKKAHLRYTLIAKSDQYQLLEVALFTGRHHQIRAQLAHIGCPIKGDLKYGFDRSNPDGGIHLHARKLSFVHPVSKDLLQLTAPCPKDSLWQHFENLAT